VAWVGLTEGQTEAQGVKVKKGLFPLMASGRAIATRLNPTGGELLNEPIVLSP